MHTSAQLPAVVAEIIIAFTLERRLRERAKMVRYTHTAILLIRNLFNVIQRNTSVHFPHIKSPRILVPLASGLRIFHTSFVHRPWNGEYVTYLSHTHCFSTTNHAVNDA